jgi:plasmid maintenance system antidote protein VapI
MRLPQRKDGFEELLALLRIEINRRISDGATSQRALARSAQVSQSHLHNVLKGERSLTPEVADRLLGVLGLQIKDLLDLPDHSLTRQDDHGLRLTTSR